MGRGESAGRGILSRCQDRRATAGRGRLARRPSAAPRRSASMMRTITFPGTDVVSSALGFGCADLYREPTAVRRRRLLDVAHGAGIRHFDVAPMYGHASTTCASPAAPRSSPRGRRTRRSGEGVVERHAAQPARGQLGHARVVAQLGAGRGEQVEDLQRRRLANVADAGLYRTRRASPSATRSPTCRHR